MNYEVSKNRIFQTVHVNSYARICFVLYKEIDTELFDIILIIT